MIAAITGSSGGIGREVANLLHDQGYRIIHVGRDRTRHGNVVRGSDAFVECELSKLDSIVIAAGVINNEVETVDVLINNAASAGKRGPTPDGFEWAFGVNYLSHYLLTRLLREPKRIVNVSSEVHRSVQHLDSGLGLRTRGTVTGVREYAFSKAALIAFTVALVSRGFAAYSAHPGMVATGIWRRIPIPLRGMYLRRMLPPELGAVPVVRAATDRSLSPGDYVTPQGVVAPSSVVTHTPTTEMLWEESERMVAAYLP